MTLPAVTLAADATPVAVEAADGTAAAGASNADDGSGTQVSAPAADEASAKATATTDSTSDSSDQSDVDPELDPAAVSGSDRRSDLALPELPNASCLTRTICAIKDKIRWQTPAWTPTQCNNIAKAVLSSSERYSISPSLLLAVMINESDMNEKASRPTVKDHRIYAQDSGLMAIRCVLDKRSRCMNGNVRGMSWKDLMKPATNIELGAHELAYWRDGGAVMRTTVKVRGADGRLRPVSKVVPCRHKDHAYWAHYNHGPMYIAHGYARHYPHRVAVLDHALATVLNVDAPELRGKITIHDVGRRERTVDRPLEPRYKKLCSQIESVGGCSAVAVN